MTIKSKHAYKAAELEMEASDRRDEELERTNRESVSKGSGER